MGAVSWLGRRLAGARVPRRAARHRPARGGPPTQQQTHAPCPLQSAGAREQVPLSKGPQQQGSTQGPKSKVRRRGSRLYQLAMARERDSELPCAGTFYPPPPKHTRTRRHQPQPCTARHVTLARTLCGENIILVAPYGPPVRQGSHSGGSRGWRSDRLGTARCSAEATGDCSLSPQR